MKDNIEWKPDISQILTVEESLKKEKIRKLYLEKRLTIKQLAKKMNWTYHKTINELHKYRIRKHDLMPINIEEWKLIYIAGLFDGEGSIYILQRSETLQRNRRLKICFYIGMTDKKADFIRYLRKRDIEEGIKEDMTELNGNRFIELH